jgi:hypothetical protein
MNRAINSFHNTSRRVRTTIFNDPLDSARMERLKQDLDQTELDCDIINRREKLLNFRLTKFTAVANLKTDMTPFMTLWSIA